MGDGSVLHHQQLEASMETFRNAASADDGNPLGADW